MKNNFVITVPYYNSKWVDKCLDSIKTQSYKNFRVIVFDDSSTDGSYEKALKWLKDNGDNRFSIIRSDVNGGSGMGGHIRAIDNSEAGPEDIIVNVDGDDWLADDGVLQHLNGIYNDGALMTYGQFEPVGKEYPPQCAKVPDTKTYRKSKLWKTKSYASHLRTFKKKAFDKLNRDDFIDPHDSSKYLQMASEMPLVFGLLEICGNKRSVFVDRIMYIYNNHNDINIMRKNPERQISNAQLVSEREPYKQQFEE